MQAIDAEGEEYVVADCSTDTASPAFLELRQLRATAFAVYLRLARLEEICQYLYDSAGIPPPRAR